MSWFNGETKAEKIIRRNRKALTAREANIMMSEMLLAMSEELRQHDDCAICNNVTGSTTEVAVYNRVATVLREKAEGLTS